MAGDLQALIDAVRRNKRELDAAGEALRDELKRPAPLLGLHPFAQRLAARQDPFEEVHMDTGYLRCSICAAIAKCGCGCDRPIYVRAGTRFLAAKGFGQAVTQVVTKPRTGRRPIGAKAMTPAERQRRARAKRRHK